MALPRRALRSAPAAGYASLGDVSVPVALARVVVPDLEAALPLYVALAGGGEPRRFAFRGIELAWIGPFLLLAGTPEALAPYRDRVATVLVDDVHVTAALIVQAGGSVVDGPDAGPNGQRLVARHPDGAVFEYIATGSAEPVSTPPE
ncbi:MAG: VOC family protein [Candidatus Dormibacteria bacterium]